jgi:hypothetical protein
VFDGWQQDPKYPTLYRAERDVVEPFTDMPSSAPVRWVQPRLVAMIDYREFNGRFRHPAFKGLLHADPTIVPLPADE